MIFGVDTSKYQPPGSYDPGAFEIINAEDPTMPEKVARNVADNRPWSLYVWVYAGEAGAHIVDRLQAALGRAGVVPSLLDGWYDYEDAGVSQNQLAEAFAAADARGLTTGYYSNAGTVNHGEFLDRAWWLAAYPGNNDGSFPGLDAMRAPRPVNIWQFSSTQGRLDVNVIVDEAWYASLGDDMTEDEVRAIIDRHLTEDTPYGTRFGVLTEQYQNTVVPPYPYSRFQAWWRDTAKKFGVTTNP